MSSHPLDLPDSQSPYDSPVPVTPVADNAEIRVIIHPDTIEKGMKNGPNEFYFKGKGAFFLSGLTSFNFHHFEGKGVTPEIQDIFKGKGPFLFTGWVKGQGDKGFKGKGKDGQRSGFEGKGKLEGGQAKGHQHKRRHDDGDSDVDTGDVSSETPKLPRRYS